MNSTILAAVLCNSVKRVIALLHPARVPDSIRAATLRAAYDSPGVTNMSRSCGSDRVQSSHGSHHGTAGCADPSSCGIVGVCEIDTWLVEAYQRDMR